MVVDQKGWDDATELLLGTLDKLLEIQAEASERLAASGEKSMLSKAVILHFKSPEPSDGTAKRRRPAAQLRTDALRAATLDKYCRLIRTML